MSKILKNASGSSVLVSDVGITISASPGSYTIPANDYLLWAASSDVVTLVGAGTLVVNDGSVDLSISDGIDLIKGLFPSKIVVIDASTSLTIFKQNDMNVASKAETDLTSVTYTVPAGKRFKFAAFNASYSVNFPIYVRFKQQIGGAGSFVQLYRIALGQHPQDALNGQIDNPLGANIGAAGDVFKVTFEAALIKGNIWASFSGVEFNV